MGTYSPPIFFDRDIGTGEGFPLNSVTYPLVFNTEMGSLAIQAASDKTGGYVSNTTQSIAGAKTFLSIPKCSSGAPPTQATELTCKSYVDSKLSGFVPLDDIDAFDDASILTPGDGYRVIQTVTTGSFVAGNVYTYDAGGPSWIEYMPAAGAFAYVIAETKSYIYSSLTSTWAEFRVSVGGNIICDTLATTSGTSSSSTATGDIVTAGGIGCGENIYAGGLVRCNTLGVNADPSAGIAAEITGVLRLDETPTTRLLLPCMNQFNMWGIDNFTGGVLRFYRNEYSATGVGPAGTVRMSLSDAGTLRINSTSAAQLTLVNGSGSLNVTTDSAGDATFNASGNDLIMHSSDRILVQNTTASTAKSNGALVVSGGIGSADRITANQFVTDNSSTVDSFSAEFYAPSLQVTKYHGIRFGQSGTTWNCADLRFYYNGAGDTTNYVSLGPYGYASALKVNLNGITSYMADFTTTSTPQLRVGYDAANYCNFTLSSTGDLTLNATGNDINFHSSDTVTVLNTAGSTSSTTGALQVKGGLGVTENIYAGGNIGTNQLICTDISLANSTLTTGTGSNFLYSALADGQSVQHRIGKNASTKNFGQIYYNHTTDADNSNSFGLSMNGTNSQIRIRADGVSEVTGTAASTSTTTGCLVLSGGLGIAGNVYTAGVFTRTTSTDSRTSAEFYSDLAIGNTHTIRVGMSSGDFNNGYMRFHNVGGPASVNNYITWGLSDLSLFRMKLDQNGIQAKTAIFASDSNDNLTIKNNVGDHSHLISCGYLGGEFNVQAGASSGARRRDFRFFSDTNVGESARIIVGDNVSDSRMAAVFSFNSVNGIGDSDNYCEIAPTNVSVQGLRVTGGGEISWAPVYDDLQMIHSATPYPGTAPVFEQTLAGVWGWKLVQNLQTGLVFSTQLSHSWLSGSKIYLHGHFIWTGAGTPGITRFSVTIWIKKIDSSSTFTYTGIVDYDSSGVSSNTQKLVELFEVPATNLGHSCIINTSILRSGNASEDTDDRPAYLLAADFHYARSRPGELLGYTI